MPTGSMRGYAVLAGITLVGIGIINTLNLSHFMPPQGIDFASYYGAAKALWAHQSPYQATPPFAGCDTPSPYAYPTLFAYLVIPLTALSCQAGHIVWNWVSVALMAGTLCLMQTIWPQPMRRFVLLCLATWVCYPLWSGLQMGQVHVLILFLVLVALWRIKRNDAWGAGVALALACWIQVIPGLLVIYLMLRREWRVVWATWIAGGCMLGLMLLLNAPAALAWPTGLAEMLRVDHQIWNTSVLYVWGMWLAVPIAAVYLLVVRRFSWDAGYVWTIATMLLLTPTAYNFMPLWLIPVAWLALRSPRWRVAGWIGLASIYLLTNIVWFVPYLLIAVWAAQLVATIMPRRAVDQREPLSDEGIPHILASGVDSGHV